MRAPVYRRPPTLHRPPCPPTRRAPPPRSPIDTSKASVARAALEAGASLVNDVTALRGDPEMAAVVCAERRGVLPDAHARRAAHDAAGGGPALRRRGRRGQGVPRRAPGVRRGGGHRRGARAARPRASASARRSRTTSSCCAACASSPRSAARWWWGPRARASSGASSPTREEIEPAEGDASRRRGRCCGPAPGHARHLRARLRARGERAARARRRPCARRARRRRCYVGRAMTGDDPVPGTRTTSWRRARCRPRAPRSRAAQRGSTTAERRGTQRTGSRSWSGDGVRWRSPRRAGRRVRKRKTRRRSTIGASSRSRSRSRASRSTPTTASARPSARSASG